MLQNISKVKIHENNILPGLISCLKMCAPKKNLPGNIAMNFTTKLQQDIEKGNLFFLASDQ